MGLVICRESSGLVRSNVINNIKFKLKVMTADVIVQNRIHRKSVFNIQNIESSHRVVKKSNVSKLCDKQDCECL